MKLKFKILNKFIKFLIYIKFVGPVMDYTWLSWKILKYLSEI